MHIFGLICGKIWKNNWIFNLRYFGWFNHQMLKKKLENLKTSLLALLLKGSENAYSYSLRVLKKAFT